MLRLEITNTWQSEEFYKQALLCFTLHSINSLQKIEVFQVSLLPHPFSDNGLVLPESVFQGEDFFQEPLFQRR